MNILISNDDGIHAKGIEVLHDCLKEAGHNVYVIAPAKEESGTGHGVTLHRPLRLQKINKNNIHFGYAVDGKPSDCIKLGYWGVFKDKKIDMIISGINRGENLGTDVLYSGTVSAAAEGALSGVRSIAVSLYKPSENPNYETAGKFLVKFLEEIDELEFPKESLLNINVPDLKFEDILGYKYTKQGDRKYIDNFIERDDPRGDKYYWLGGEVCETGDDPNYDFNVVKSNYISVTPINLDLTDYKFLSNLKGEYNK
ncbi:5'/3'-nucleotidase SurE [Haliovirga abyssi]|uniref:5'-nucleotidase SurE n=1 Tax=Haliovirga abyssi TaxID=2996794 RepID=A0AAU9DFM4_9FUSO|nr:5'/3'-nucleotidase SurE [Haliovirga abyssi]BDU51008.1 5'-nucleotidase SurE [Haliovirga abyssi]